MFEKLKQTIIALALVIGIGGLFLVPLTASAAQCGGVSTSIVDCDKTGCADESTPVDGKCADGSTPTVDESGLWGILLLVINILTGGVGIAAIGGIAYGAIMYTTAGGNMDKVKQGKEIITNTVIGLVAYALMFSLLNYLIPGGLFN